MLRRLLFCLILFSSISSMSFPSQLHVIATDQMIPLPTPLINTNGGDIYPPTPIPAGCIGVTPPGAPEALCCISGFVYMDGEIIDGAEVKIRTASGAEVVLYTQIYSTSTTLPHYRLNLNAPPLNVIVGETITVTARYSSHERSLAYVVQPGGQQVDVVLNRTYNDDYVYERQIHIAATPGVFTSPEGMAVAPDGTLYVVDRKNNRIQVFSADGAFQRMWGRLGSRAGEFFEPHGIALDRSGNVYVTDQKNNRIQKFSSTGIWLATWGTQGQGNGQFWYPAGIAIDTDGYVYIVDSINKRIQKFTSVGIWVTGWGSNGSSDGQFLYPTDISVGLNNDIYITDSLGYRVQRFNASGVWLGTWGSQGSNHGQFASLSGIATDTIGNVYVVDMNNYRIQKFTNTGTWLATWGSFGIGDGTFFFPRGIVINATNNIYVSDQYTDRIQVFNGNGQWVKTFVQPDSSHFNHPQGIDIDSLDNIYVVDSHNSQIKKFDDQGMLIQIWGNYGTGTGLFWFPTGIAIDSHDNVYIADTGNNRIQKFTSDGIWVQSWGNEGSANGQMLEPEGITIGPDGNLYVADTGNHRIQIFSATGEWIATWGSYGNAHGQLIEPLSIAVDINNTLYVTERGNGRIQRFTNTGIFMNAWGSTMEPDGFFDWPSAITIDHAGMISVVDSINDRIELFTDEGIFKGSWGAFGGRSGYLMNPSGVVIDTYGKMYISDSENNRIQIFRRMTYTKPIATITHASATSLAYSDTLVLRGMGQASDQTPLISEYQWTSNRNGVIGNTSTLSRIARTLATGPHQISLRVKDSEGSWSEAVTTNIFIAEPNKANWTMLLYLAGDFHDREKQLTAFNTTIQTLRTTFRNPAVRIAIQIDGPASGDTRRLLITPGTSTTPPTILETTIGELAMDHPTTLRDFIIWGQQTFPAPNYYLAVANHGQAVQGIAWDTTSDMLDDGIQNDSSYLTVQELGSALNAPDVAPIALLHLDACAMNLVETAYEIRTKVGILIASQYLAWDYFAYDRYQQAIGANTSVRMVALGITQRYAARADHDHVPYTIVALDLSRVVTTLTALDRLAAELAALVNNNATNRILLDEIWQQSQRFESNGDYQITQIDSYVDLVDWASRILIGVNSPAVKAEAANLITELTGPHPFIVAGSHYAQSQSLPPQYASGAYIDLADAHGVSIFYPRQSNSVVYDNYINNRLFSFTSQSRWADFLMTGVGISPPGELVPPFGPLPTLRIRQVYLPFLIK